MELVLDLLLSHHPVEDTEGRHRRRAARGRVSLLDKDCAAGDGLGADLRTGQNVGLDTSAKAAGLAGDERGDVEVEWHAGCRLRCRVRVFLS